MIMTAKPYPLHDLQLQASEFGKQKASRSNLSRCMAVLILLSFAGLASAQVVVFDNMSNYEGGNTNANVTATASVPNTFMGDAYNLGGATSITGFDIFPVNLSGSNYTGLRMTIYVWGTVNTSGTVNSTTPAFGNLLNTYTFTSSGTYNSGFFFPFEGSPVGSAPGITLSSPLTIPNPTVGITFNFQGTYDGVNYFSTNSLTSVISYGLTPTVGSQIFNGYYRNASSENNGNFISSLRQLGGLNNQSLALRIFGVPEPSSAALAGLGVATFLAMRRRKSGAANRS
jgi:hypothetical protein